MRSRWVLLLPAMVAIGCTGSRWARDDPDYAAKYPHHTDNLARMTKQAVDARHVKGKSGPYAGVSGRGDPFALGGEAGVFRYPTSYVELRGGLAGLVYEGMNPLSAGVLGGVRVQSPSRLAPFAGLGAYGGLTPDFRADDDGIDNDHDGFVDNSDETENDLVAAVFPEAGLHFWITPEWRLTASASYLVTSAGDADFPLYSISLARLTDPGGPTSTRGLAQAAADNGWQVGDGANPSEYRMPSTTDFAGQSLAAPPLASPIAE